MPTLDELITQAEKLQRQQEALVRDLKALRALQSKSGSKQIKHPDGRLTEEGVKHLYAGFAAGKSLTVIAKSLDISVPAAIYRRNKWQAEQARRKSK